LRNAGSEPGKSPASSIGEFGDWLVRGGSSEPTTGAALKEEIERQARLTPALDQYWRVSEEIVRELNPETVDDVRALGDPTLRNFGLIHLLRKREESGIHPDWTAEFYTGELHFEGRSEHLLACRTIRTLDDVIHWLDWTTEYERSAPDARAQLNLRPH
jgi:hypothetical protein